MYRRAIDLQEGDTVIIYGTKFKVQYIVDTKENRIEVFLLSRYSKEPIQVGSFDEDTFELYIDSLVIKGPRPL